MTPARRRAPPAASGAPFAQQGDVAATDPQQVPRPNVEARLAMLRGALGSQAEADDGTAGYLLRTVLLLTSPQAPGGSNSGKGSNVEG